MYSVHNVKNKGHNILGTYWRSACLASGDEHRAMVPVWGRYELKDSKSSLPQPGVGEQLSQVVADGFAKKGAFRGL